MKTDMTLWDRDQVWDRLGIIEDMPMATYHAGPGLHSGDLKRLEKTPAHYFANKMAPPGKETASQRLGTLYHMRTLERVSSETYVKVIDGNRNALDVKQQILEAERNGQYVCKTEELETADAMASSTLDPVKRAHIRSLLSGGKPEVSVYWRDAETQVLCCARFDYLNLEKAYGVDLKSFDKLGAEDLMKQLFSQRYMWQSAFYMDGLSALLGKPVNMLAHVFCETDAPYEAVCGVLDDAALERARAEYRPLINLYAECLKTNTWPGYPQEILGLSYPSWSWGG